MEICEWKSWVGIMEDNNADDLWLSILLPLLPILHTFSADNWDAEGSYHCTSRVLSSIAHSEALPLPCLDTLRLQPDVINSTDNVWIGPLSGFKALEDVDAAWETIIAINREIAETLPSSLQSLTIHDHWSDHVKGYGTLLRAILAPTSHLAQFEKLTLVSNTAIEEAELKEICRGSRVTVEFLDFKGYNRTGGQ